MASGTEPGHERVLTPDMRIINSGGITPSLHVNSVSTTPVILSSITAGVNKRVGLNQTLMN